MAAVESVIDIQTFSEWLGLSTDSSKQSLSNTLNSWTSDTQRLQNLSSKFKHFKDIIKKDPAFFKRAKTIFTEVATIESKMNDLLNNDSKLEKESYNEILFFNPVLQPLNFVPFILTIWAFVRVYLLPGISLLLPLLTLIAPYFILKFLFCIPITFNNYMNILQSMISGNFQAIVESDPTKPFISEKVPVVALLKQVGLIGMTIVQGFLQPYWTHKHLKSIDDIINENGILVYRFRELYDELSILLEEHGCTFYRCPLPETHSKRDGVAQTLLNPTYFKIALKYIGSVEVILTLASKLDVYPVTWVSSKTPLFSIKDTFDYQVSVETRKTVCAEFRTNRHALLTGPNKGGKSTALRALSVSALIAHTYGCALGHLVATPFSKMCVCLKPDDLPGSKSRFEREIEFTANTLKNREPILIFIDELYHSTNPPDALRSCEIYCEKLWKMENIVSVISTHLFELVEKANPNIQRLCCPASIDEKKVIHFEYDLKPGICKVSSVDTLLSKYGL